MKITITRNNINPTSCTGELKILDNDSNVIFKCYTLEEDKEGLESGKDLRIPSGDYKLRYHSPSRFEATLRKILNDNKAKMINVYNDEVPKERCILIHWGNTHKDTLGCILLGKGLGKDSITQSRDACKEFYKILSTADLSEVKVEIKNNF